MLMLSFVLLQKIILDLIIGQIICQKLCVVALKELKTSTSIGFVQSYSMALGNFEQLFVSIFLKGLLVEKIVELWFQIVALQGKILEIVASQHLLWYMFEYIQSLIGSVVFFFKFENETLLTLLNK